MRTLEQIKADEYENLTYGELVKYDLSCDYCPLKDEFCSGGVACYGGEPIYPPCESFEEEDVLYEIYENWECSRRKDELAEEERERVAELKKKKSEERKKKIRQYQLRNMENLLKISALKKKIKWEKKRIEAVNRLSIFASAVNITNKMFRDAHQPNDVKDIDTNPHKDFIKECEEKISEYKKDDESSEIE